MIVFDFLINDDYEVVQFEDLPSPVILEFLVSVGINGDAGDPGGYQSPSPTAVVDGTMYTIPPGKKLQGITPIPVAGGRIITVGYSTGSGELLDAEPVDSNDAPSFGFGAGIYYHTGKIIHFSGFTGSVLIYLL